MVSTTENKVLIVDDETELLELIADMAEIEGFSPTKLSDSTKFREIYDDSYKLIFLDLMMPEVDGVEVLRYLGEFKSQVPIVLMSGFDDGVLNVATELAKEHQLTIVDTVTKPFRVQSIRELLQHGLSESKRPESANKSELVVLTVDSIVNALSANEFCFYYQPQINLKDESIYGFEALARWEHPEHGVVAPDTFITFLEKNALISTLSLALIEPALSEFKHLPGGESTKLSINISTDQLSELTLPDFIAKEVNKSGITPGRITLEVTETGLIQDIKTSLDILARFRLKGFNLSIDDFGTGSAMYEHLQKLPINELKIDKSFVAKVFTDTKSRIIVDHTVSLAKDLGLKTIAEGVESREIAQYLNAAGVDIAQGYYYAKPLPFSQAKELRFNQ